jgi:hypothetical protein
VVAVVAVVEAAEAAAEAVGAVGAGRPQDQGRVGEAGQARAVLRARIPIREVLARRAVASSADRETQAPLPVRE